MVLVCLHRGSIHFALASSSGLSDLTVTCILKTKISYLYYTQMLWWDSIIKCLNTYNYSVIKSDVVENRGTCTPNLTLKFLLHLTKVNQLMKCALAIISGKFKCNRPLCICFYRKKYDTNKPSEKKMQKKKWKSCNKVIHSKLMQTTILHNLKPQICTQNNLSYLGK